jgi:hypothetical protein
VTVVIRSERQISSLPSPNDVVIHVLVSVAEFLTSSPRSERRSDETEHSESRCRRRCSRRLRLRSVLTRHGDGLEQRGK